MLSARIIPSLLLDKGRLVKGVRYGAHRDAGNPPTTARAYNAQKADELLLLDINASRENRGPDLESVAAVARECFMPLSVGGGISSVEIATACFANGADKVCLTSTALDNPGLLGELAEIFGRQAVVLGVDVLDGKLFDHRSGATRFGDWLDWIEDGVKRGAGEIRLMAVDREGKRTGMAIDLYQKAAARVDVPIILEGGAGNLEDLAHAMKGGVQALALGSMLVFSDNNIIQLKRYLKNKGHAVRL